jgi:hypothetical protein
VNGTKETAIMTRSLVRRAAAFAVIALIAMGSLGCTTTTGVGYGAPVYGGWGGPSGIYGGSYGGRPVWP